MAIDPTAAMLAASRGAEAGSATSMQARMKAAAQSGNDEQLLEAAQKFEQFFVQSMLQEMRATAKMPGEGMFDSSAMDTWTEQLDQEVAGQISRGRGMGLSKVIAQSLRNTYGATTTPGAVGKDGWSWPLPAAELGSVSSDFGHRVAPVHGASTDHQGLDIAAPAGTAVLAAADGVVTRAENAGSYGLLVEIDHGDGIVTRYAHQSAMDVAVGEAVSAGDRLGSVGSTGRSSGPHLHLEVRVDGVPVDPLEFLDGRGDTELRSNRPD